MRPRTPFHHIDVNSAAQLLDREDLLVLDVRDASSYSSGRIQEAHNVSFSNLSPIVDGAPREMPVLIYCYHGFASQEYAQVFSDFGFREVYSLDGGYDAWTMQRENISCAQTP